MNNHVLASHDASADKWLQAKRQKAAEVPPSGALPKTPAARQAASRAAGNEPPPSERARAALTPTTRLRKSGSVKRVASAVGEGAQGVAALHAALASQSDSTASTITPGITPPGPNTGARQSARPGNR
jgi:hypothetical protein